MSVRSISQPRSKKSHFNMKQVKSQEGDPDPEPKTNTQWYQNKIKVITNPLPSSIPLMKHSEPFRLIITKITGLQPSKKSTHSHIYLRISLTLLTVQMQPIGTTCIYQCQTPYNSNSKNDMDICFYYHSKIDKGCKEVKMVIRMDCVQIRQGLVEGVIGVGVGVMEEPFIEEDHKETKLFKECSEIEAAGGFVDNFTTSGVYLTYSIESSLQLKNLIKFIPPETLVSSQTHIAGVLGSYLPSSKNTSIQEQDILFVNVDVCEIQIPQKFQTAVTEAISLLSSLSTPQILTHRKIICGYHNQFQTISPVSRILQSSGRITTGGDTINAYQALSDGEVIKIPYYFQQQINVGSCAVTLSLVYVYGKNECEISIFAIQPNISGTRQELSVRMITGSGIGFVGNLLPVKTNKNPTLIMEYQSQDFHKARQYRRSVKLQSKRNSKQSDLESSRVVMAELERERLVLQREKSELEILRTQNYISHQDDFEKKLQEQRNQLRIRQEMIQNQYRQEVEKQIRIKMELENEIRAMKERLTAIQQDKNKQILQRKPSHDPSPVEYDRSFEQSFSDGQTGNLMRHRINADYLVEEEKTVPISDIRDMMARTVQISNETMQKEQELFNFASKFSFMFNSVVWSTGIEPPKTFYFVIKFFNFKQFRSDPIGYIESGHQYCQLVRWNNYAYNLQNTTPCYEFTVDPSEFSNPKILQQDLVKFMSKNSTIIDIFDAQNFLYIGQINIKMHELFRGNKSQTMIAKEYNLVKMKKQQNFGSIQVLIKNQMVQCQEEIEVKENRKVKEVRKKVISNNPIHLSKQIVSQASSIEKVGGIVQVKNRQQKRIQMYKKKVTESKLNKNFDDFESKQKGYLIDKINDYKQKKMPDFIKNIYEQMLSQTITINPYFGQAKTFPYQFTNISQGPSSFRITIQNSTEELELVKQVSEWKHFVNQNGYAVPKIYDCINDESSFYLAAGQTIPLVFKYLSFQKSGTNNQKTINVTITKEQNSWVVGGFTLKVQSHDSIINHSYILYQPGNQIVDLIIPVIYSTNDSRAPKRLYLTVENAQAQWLNQYEVLLKIRVPQIMSKLKFNMLLYEDDYFCKLKENWLVELFAYQGVYAVSRENQKTNFKISIPQQVISSIKPHKVSFFSSYPGLVFESSSLQGVKLARGSAEIWCQLFPDRDLIGTIQITCVSEKGELLYGWIVQIYPYTPKIT